VPPARLLDGRGTQYLRSKRRVEKRERIPPSPGHTPLRAGLSPQSSSGWTFFFTVNLLDRRSDLLVTQIHMLRDAPRQVRLQVPSRIDAWVVLPDHMHCLWTLPAGDAEFPGRWRDQDGVLERG
jgi:hypothetical protein